MVKLGKGYRGRASTNFRIAIEKVEKALRYAYRDRRRARASSAHCGSSVSTQAYVSTADLCPFHQGPKRAGIELDRKQLRNWPPPNRPFKTLVEKAEAA